MGSVQALSMSDWQVEEHQCYFCFTQNILSITELDTGGRVRSCSTETQQTGEKCTWRWRLLQSPVLIDQRQREGSLADGEILNTLSYGGQCSALQYVCLSRFRSSGIARPRNRVKISL